MSELPRGWAATDLGAVGEVYCGQSSTASDVNGEGRGTPYVTGPEQWTGSKIELNKWTTTPKRKVPEGCIFITVKGAGVGKMFPGVACAIGRDVYAYQPSKQLSYPFVMRALANTVNSVIREARGDIPGLSKEHITDHTVPLPPLAEQKRIVAKLDALNAKSARARNELARIETLVSRYKQAVLSRAFSGELTASNVSGWSPCTLGELAIDVRYGTAEKCTYAPELTPVLRIPNVADGRIDLSDLKHASFNDKELKKLALVKGDLLVIRSNGSVDLVGRSAVVGPSAVGMLFAGYLIRIRLDPTRASPFFIQHWMQSVEVRRTIEDAAKSTSGVNNVNSQQLQALKLSLPPIAEQHHIVDRIESAFAKINRLESEAKRALELIGKLDEAILAKAFRGELVLQYENDEPASNLLNRIRAEREGAPGLKRGRTKVS